MAGISNEQLVEKAIITTNALAVAGRLNPAQSDKFIDYVVQETVLKDNARIVRFRNEELEIDKIGIGKRVALPKAEAADPSLRRGVTTSKIILRPREIIVPFEIGDILKEVNIEGDGVEDHIIQMMARQLANDLEELYLNGDALGQASIEGDIKDGGSATQHVLDSYLGLHDGWLRLADAGNLVDFQGQSIGLNVFSRMLTNLPTKFRRNRANLRFYLSPDLSQFYTEKLSSRATQLGDAATTGQGHSPFGVRLVEVPLFRFLPRIVEHLAFTGAGSTITLRYRPVQNVVVHLVTLNAVAANAFVAPTDYTLNAANGTITHAGVGSAIGANASVKVTYDANPQVLLTHQANWLVGIGRDIRIEKDREIFKGVNQYAITAKVAVQLEETTAVVKGNNISTTV